MATLIKYDGTETAIEPKNGTDFSLEELQGYVSGYIEVVLLGDGKMMIVDEEGLLKQLHRNPKATRLVGYTIVGDVVVCQRNEVK